MHGCDDRETGLFEHTKKKLSFECEKNIYCCTLAFWCVQAILLLLARAGLAANSKLRLIVAEVFTNNVCHRAVYTLCNVGKLIAQLFDNGRDWCVDVDVYLNFIFCFSFIFYYFLYSLFIAFFIFV